MKTVLTTLIILVISIISSYAGNNGDAKASEITPITNLVDFTGKHISDKLYVNWQVKGEKENCLYVLERSADGKNFEPQFMKEGYGSPIQAVFMHSWVEEISKEELELYTYRLKKIENTGKVGISEALEIEYRENKTRTYAESDTPVKSL